MARKRQTPTHVVTHKKNWVAHLHIPDLTQRKLKSADPMERQAAHNFICKRFLEACRSKFGTEQFDFDEILWEDLKVESLVNRRTSSTPDAAVSAPADIAQAPTSAAQTDEDERECDECPSCDQGHHERCGQPKGCPNAIAWPSRYRR